MSLLYTTCCCDNCPDSCECCLQTVSGDSIDTICCKSPDEIAIVQIKRPARTVRFCRSIPIGPPGPGCPCCGPVTVENAYASRPDHLVAYTGGECDWLWVFNVDIPDACNACDSCSGDDYACGTAHSIFGQPMLDCMSCQYGRWTEYQSGIAAASEQLRWWNDIQCYKSGGYISASEYGYAPTVYGTPCTRGSNPGGTYILADYYLGTFHRRITWYRDCYSDTFGSGAESVECMTPEYVQWCASGAPLFEMDLYAAADTDRWGRNALDITLVERFICACREGGAGPSQSDIEAVFNHPSGMLTTKDWRPQQTSDDAYLATLYPTEYGSCTAQTATVGVCVKRCWPAIQPELVVSAMTVQQATCLPSPTAPMEANPAWQIRRPTYFRPRPGFWTLPELDTGCASPFQAFGIRFDGAPFGTPTCTGSGPPCAGYPTCDYCDPLSTCPPTLAVQACAVSIDCTHKMLAASCDGVMWVYAEIQLEDCAQKHTCIKTDPEQDCEEASCQGWYARESYVNYAYLYTVEKPCAWDGVTSLYACVPVDPPISPAQAWAMIVGQSQLDEESARIANIAAGTGDCAVVQCEECDECTGAGFPVEEIGGGEADKMPCGTFTQVGDNTSFNPCLDTCWVADPCEGECQTPGAISPCLPAPDDPCA